MAKTKLKTAILLPAYNEEEGIAHVINGFKASMPAARIVVCDNNSTDKTAQVSKDAGAEVYYQPLPGKGNAMRRLFREIEALYVMYVTLTDHMMPPQLLSSSTSSPTKN